jgi:hypothetical protein
MRFLALILFAFSACISHPVFAQVTPGYTVFNDNSSTTITTAAYVQLVASTAVSCSQLVIFNSSSKAIVLALGAASSEANIQYDIPPSANILTTIPVRIPSGLRLSAKAVAADATTGLLIINCLR